jgi:hypothetical protein
VPLQRTLFSAHCLTLDCFLIRRLCQPSPSVGIWASGDAGGDSSWASGHLLFLFRNGIEQREIRLPARDTVLSRIKWKFVWNRCNGRHMIVNHQVDPYEPPHAHGYQGAGVSTQNCFSACCVNAPSASQFSIALLPDASAAGNNEAADADSLDSNSATVKRLRSSKASVCEERYVGAEKILPH